MKNLETGELSGPPLAHDEWVKQQNAAHAAEAKAKDKSKPAAHAAGGPVPPPEDLESLTKEQLLEKARDAGLTGVSNLNKADLIAALSEKK